MNKQFFAGLVLGLLGGVGGTQLATTLEFESSPVFRASRACFFLVDADGGQVYGAEVSGQVYATPDAGEAVRPWARSGIADQPHALVWLNLARQWATAQRDGGAVGTISRACIFEAPATDGGWGLEVADELGTVSGAAPPLPADWDQSIASFTLGDAGP